MFGVSTTRLNGSPRTRSRRLTWPAAAVCAALLIVTACSGHSASHSSSQAPVSAKNTTSSSEPAPARATTTTAAATAAKSANPCTLVTKAEAQIIIGRPIEAPQEAAQGPTCIYRTPDSATFITVAVVTQNFGQIKTLIKNLNQVSGLGHEAYCGDYGRPTLYVLLSTNTLLTITAPCPAAERFAVKALARL